VVFYALQRLRRCEEGVPIEKRCIISRRIEAAQKDVETQNFVNTGPQTIFSIRRWMNSIAKLFYGLSVFSA